MGKYLRSFAAIFVFFSLVLTARNEVARAANLPAGTDRPALNPALPFVFEGGVDDCAQANNKDKEKCKDKEKDKCKNKHEDCGTVRPPDDDFDVCEQGDYAVGGAAILDVEKLQDRSKKDDCFHAHSQDSGGVGELPKNAGPVVSDLIILTSVGQGSTIKICFAAPPGKAVKIYSSNGSSWKPAGTQVINGIACAQVPSSGSFVLAGK